MTKKSPLKGRKWTAEAKAKYMATRIANGYVPKKDRAAGPRKNARHPDNNVHDAVLFLRNAERKLAGKTRLSEAELLTLLALRSLEGTL